MWVGQRFSGYTHTHTHTHTHTPTTFSWRAEKMKAKGKGIIKIARTGVIQEGEMEGE
jgi:hypothetical protein